MTSSLKCAVMLTLLMCSTTLTHAQVRQHSDLPQGVSASWWQQVQEHIRKSEYHISKRSDGRYTSPNRAQNLRFVYEPNGFSATRRDTVLISPGDITLVIDKPIPTQAKSADELLKASYEVIASNHQKFIKEGMSA